MRLRPIIHIEQSGTQMTKADLIARIHNAADIFRKLNPELPVDLIKLQQAAAEAKLPQFNLPNDNLANAIFLASHCPGTEEALDGLIDRIYEHRFVRAA